MTKYEYRAIPCPERTLRARDLPDGTDPFGQTLTAAINDLAGDGWDYVRAETIDLKTRRLFGRRSETRSFLVFRRDLKPAAEPRPVIDLGRDAERVRARRVKSEDVVTFMRGSSRRGLPEPSMTDEAV